MNYQKFLPLADLASYVECFFEWTGHAKKELDVQSPPNSFCGLVINCGAPMLAYQHASPRTQVPLAFVSGMFTSNYHLIVNGPIRVVAVVLKPYAVHDFFGIRMSTLVNSRLDLSLLPGFDLSLVHAIQQTHAAHAQIGLLQGFLLGKLSEAKTRATVINDAAKEIDRLNGNVEVGALAEQFNISKRYLEKRFLEKVGVSPKMYARIKRFGVLANQVAHAKEVDWHQVVEGADLHDQSHLIKEFKEFNKMTPNDYHQTHNEMTRFVKSVKVRKSRPPR